jgi:death-on-curing protein
MSVYLTTDEVVMMHEILLKKYGGTSGLRDRFALEAAIQRPASGYYRDEIEEASALFESLVMNHPFVDGNKRVAFAAMDVFLRINGFSINKEARGVYQAIMKMFEDETLSMALVEAWLRSNTVRPDPR